MNVTSTWRVFILLMLCSFDIFSATYTVTVNSGTGVGSLAWAITQANSNGGADIIDFSSSLVGPVQTGVLPDITGQVNIDGASWSAANSGNKLGIQLSLGGGGSYASNFRFEAGSDGSTLANLAIFGGPNAGTSVYVHANTISVNNNYFQLSSDGNTTMSTGGGGDYPASNIYILDASGTTISNNVFGKTSSGVFNDFIYANNADNTTVSSNTFGFFRNGNNMPVVDAVAISFNNGSDGVTISNNVIGNTSNTAIVVDHSINASITSNIIGFKSDGITSAPITTSVSHGIYIDYATGSTISNNTIGNVNNNAIAVSNSATLTISGNRTGVNINGNCATNGWSGISFTSISNSTISNNIAGCNNNENIYGASSTGLTITGNTLFNSPGAGIYLNGGNSSLTITSNTIYGNGNDGTGPGISLSGSDNTIQITSNTIFCNGGNSNDGIVLNGANGGISAPSGFVYGANTTSGTGTAGYTIQLFRSTTNTGSACADCEGQTLIGTAVVSGGGTWSITHNLNLTGGNENAVTATQTFGGRTSGFGGCSSSPLPVSLVSFDGNVENGNVVLSWAVALESNLNGYVIERSANGQDFDSVGFVKSGKNNYIFSEYKSPNYSKYYRLKMVDLNGSFTNSQPVSINSINKSIVFPNPTIDGISNLLLYLDSNFSSSVSVYSYDGHLLESFTIPSGTAEFKDQLNFQIRGIYLIKVINGSSIEYFQVIAQ